MILIGFYEFVDIEGLENEKRKLILVIDFYNYVMLRLRYRFGDVVIFDDESCDCGIGFLIIKEIDGRIDEIFVIKNGEVYDSYFFNILVREMEGVLQYQFVQYDLENMMFRIVKGKGFDESEVIRFVESIKSKFGDIFIKIDYVNEIECGFFGKVRYIVREYKILVMRVLFLFLKIVVFVFIVFIFDL